MNADEFARLMHWAGRPLPTNDPLVWWLAVQSYALGDPANLLWLLREVPQRRGYFKLFDAEDELYHMNQQPTRKMGEVHDMIRAIEAQEAAAAAASELLEEPAFLDGIEDDAPLPPHFTLPLRCYRRR